MVGAYGMWGLGEVHTGFWSGDLRRGKPRHRWKDNTEMVVKLITWESVGWMDFFQDRDKWQAFVNTVMSIRVP
jgi:hypothetical protein